MKTLTIRRLPPLPHREDTMPPGSGLIIAGLLSVMIWGVVALVALT